MTIAAIRGQEALEAPWMDMHALAFEARRDLGKAYQADRRGGDPIPHLYRADQRLIRISEYARRRDAEASGITYIDANQTSLWDGCGPDGRAG